MDTTHFIDTIEAEPSVRFLRSEYTEGVHIRFYVGPSGKTVSIDTTDEDISDSTAANHLIKLGLSSIVSMVVPSLFAK